MKKIREWLLTNQEITAVRITRDGGIYCLGRMPNSTESGWYIWGDVEHAAKCMEVTCV